MSVRNTANLLLVLAIVVILMRLAEPLFIRVLHDAQAVQPNGILLVNDYWTLPTLERIVVAVVSMAPRLIFIWVAFQVIRLCREFRSGEVFTLKSVTLFQKAANGVIWLAATKTLEVPVLSGFLGWRGVLSEGYRPDITGIFEILEIDILMMGVFFFLIARIMKQGLELKAEQELTI
ncbi:DUF2975 domain-containing protein [Rhodospirillaceae bacterium KN72]|uniref:DUF2975 domain-containing protein n=1 Tax=Pacificispira spongiicola TaxID=2729598 RepID=A0A7Y0HHP8_9PROT|nr:DUF2975 domain-containing protein [Pacificispira spongiicola]NMM46102.1 DUF2975 domain-containing protein [Pacificispira spongiicola]